MVERKPPVPDPGGRFSVPKGGWRNALLPLGAIALLVVGLGVFLGAQLLQGGGPASPTAKVIVERVSPTPPTTPVIRGVAGAETPTPAPSGSLTPTAPVTPTASTPTPTAARRKGRVVAGPGVNLRAGPGLDQERLCGTPPGQPAELLILGEAQADGVPWYRVRYDGPCWDPAAGGNGPPQEICVRGDCWVAARDPASGEVLVEILP